LTLALRLALGLPYKYQNGTPLIDHGSERVTFTNGKDAHLFDCFAMANLLLCSAVLKKGSQKSLAPQVMRDNCAHHLVATIGILKPTLVISQGWGLVATLRTNFGDLRPIKHKIDHCVLADCSLDGNRFVWAGLWHPTRFWSTINQRYFEETAAPAIKRARERALKLSQ
jgi:hypothetical protein